MAKGAKNMSENGETKAVARKSTAFALTTGAELTQLIQENMGGRLDPNALDRIKVPSGGLPVWMVPTLDGEDAVKEIDGIIIHKQLQNVYWEKAYGDGATNNPPDCASKDNVSGVGTPGGACETCPYNTFGSANKGKGKACKNVMVVFILQPGKLLPTAISLPPTSIPVANKFFMALTSRGVAFYKVVTRFTLEKAKNADGLEYSKVKLVAITQNKEASDDIGRVTLPAEAQARIAEYRAAIIPALTALPVMAEYTVTEEAGADPEK
jgi:hypothetical protein